MRISFLGQPFTAFGGWTADWLEQRLIDPDIREVRIASAWVKRSGLARTQAAFEAFRGRGGSAFIIVGIDEGGATSQGLHLAYDVFDRVHVFCDPSSRTYHPKVYFLSGESVAYLLVGSNNLTAGGLYSNYEGALTCHLDLTAAQDRALSDEVLAWFELMYSDTNACKHLTLELLSTLISDTQYHITDESRGRPAKERDDEDYDGIATKSPTQTIFGLSSIPKRGMAPRTSQQSRPA
ncbi:MAG: phospholipase D family protein, partial [Thermomicrobia bacterium]|nr:phospholipase D family protein [Thermomicrobia bacterium]